MTTSDLTPVAWCNAILDGKAQRLRSDPYEGAMPLVLKADALDEIVHLREALESLGHLLSDDGCVEGCPDHRPDPNDLKHRFTCGLSIECERVAKKILKDALDAQ